MSIATKINQKNIMPSSLLNNTMIAKKECTPYIE
jgi:hypothetical protein